MTNNVGYIVNVPLYFGGNEAKLEQDICQILESQSFKSNRSFKLLIGLNQKVGSLSQEAIESGVAKARKIIAEHMPQGSGLTDVEVIDFGWRAFGNQEGPNYSDIRNRIFTAQANNQFFAEYKKSGYDTIFYLTIDPDSKVSDDIFEKIEQKSQDKIAPIVQVGTFQFEVGDTELIRADGTLNWEGFLAERETEYDSLFKKEISQNEFAFVKYPYVAIKEDPAKVESNLLSLQKLRKRIIKNPENINVVLEDIDALIKLYEESIVRNRALNSKEKRSIERLEHRIGIENLNTPKRVTGSSILYPPEPILFITLFQRHLGQDYDFNNLIHQGFSSRQPLWGSSSHVREGETLAINIRKIWRNNKAGFQDEKRDYVSFSFDYKTQIPDRALRIPPHLLAILPKDVQSLKAILQSEARTLKLIRQLKAIVAGRAMSSLSKNFIEQRERSIKGLTIVGTHKPSRFGQLSAGILSKTAREYFEINQERYIEMLFQDILGQLHQRIGNNN